MKLSMVLCVVKTFSYIMLSVNCSVLQVLHEPNCENKVTLNWLWNVRNNDRCLNVIVEKIFISKCFYDELFHSKFVRKMNDLNAIISRNVRTLPSTNCDNFLFFLQRSNDAFRLFEANNQTKRFVPFSQLFLVIAESDNIQFDSNILNYIYANGLFVYVVTNTYASTNDFRFLNMENVLTGETLNLSTANRNDVIRYFGSYEKHPFLNTTYKEKVFRVSLFNCAPYVVYLADGTYDGVQYRMLGEIAKGWKVDHKICDFSSTIHIPWNAVLNNVDEDISDLAMCSNWMTKPLSKYDPSTYIDLQCGTFLVPKPKALSPASYLYLSLNANDWCGFIISLILMALSFTIVTKIGMSVFDTWGDLEYNHFSRSLTDALGMAANHGLVKFPKENSIKFLVNSWLIVSFVVGIGYSTGYTCLLHKPVFMKSLDTLEQLVDSNLVILVNNEAFAKTLVESGSESNINLAKHVILDTDTIDPSVRVKRIDKQAVFVKIILKNYIGEINNNTDPQYRLRIMKTCILNQFTVVVLKKYSSYTRYVNQKIRRLQENGLIPFWASMAGTRTNYMRPYFNEDDATKNGMPKKLSIQNLSGAFLLLIIGLSSAGVVHIFEFFVIYSKFTN